MEQCPEEAYECIHSRLTSLYVAEDVMSTEGRRHGKIRNAPSKQLDFQPVSSNEGAIAEGEQSAEVRASPE